jgi:hypothetical protein
MCRGMRSNKREEECHAMGDETRTWRQGDALDHGPVKEDKFVYQDTTNETEFQIASWNLLLMAQLFSLSPPHSPLEG